MEKTVGMLNVELNDPERRDIRDQLGDLWARTGSLNAVATALGRSRATVSFWLEKLDGREAGTGEDRSLVFDGYKRFRPVAEVEELS